MFGNPLKVIDDSVSVFFELCFKSLFSYFNVMSLWSKLANLYYLVSLNFHLALSLTIDSIEVIDYHV